MQCHLTEIALFKGCTSQNLDTFIKQTSCYVGRFVKGDLLILQGSTVHSVGILLSGQVKAYHITSGGEERVHSILYQGDMFGYVLMSSLDSPSPVNVEALSDVEVLFVPLKAILSTDVPCADTIRINLLQALSLRCRTLTRTIEYLSERTIRGRISGFLLSEKEKRVSNVIVLPFSREAFSKILCVNRSALSRELSSMQKDGLIRFYRNEFTILHSDELKKIIEHDMH